MEIQKNCPNCSASLSGFLLDSEAKQISESGFCWRCGQNLAEPTGTISEDKTLSSVRQIRATSEEMNDSKKNRYVLISFVAALVVAGFFFSSIYYFFYPTNGGISNPTRSTGSTGSSSSYANYCPCCGTGFNHSGYRLGMGRDAFGQISKIGLQPGPYDTEAHAFICEHADGLLK